MTEQMNVPKLRFEEFSENWQAIELGELMTFKNGINASKEQYGRGVKFINVMDIIENDYITYDRIVGSVDVEDKEFEKNIVEYGDILFQRSSETREEVGQANVYLDKKNVATFGGFVIRGKKIGNFDSVCMNYLLKTDKARKEVTTKSGGSTRYNVGQATLSAVNIDLPPCISEQQKIASFLSKVDEKITLLTEKKDKLTEYKKGVMQQLFNGKWKEQDGQLIFIPPTLRFKADDGSEFPDWEEKKLGSLADLTSSKRVYLSDYSEDGVPFFRGKEISEIRKGIIPDDVLYITRKAFEEFKSKYGAPVEGDILVTAVGTLANILRVTGEFEFYFKDGNLIWLRKPRCDSKFLSILMEANKHELLKTAIGSSQKALTIVELKKIVFKMPSLEEQQKITMFLSSLEEKVRLANSELEKAKEWKKGLLQQMFV
ncbi:TPA: restriction endonuclease subunit S [Vibrio parahaemolyticus]|nr:restriction endonuclease subunit S [Vibrio parahaemolyticus]HCE4593004.1 restriction endonuclease subunit S [Vibrio parahaemolyticus]HCG5928098.1 restriction endonuclease subunit S [Vibrio parahaemolyticus]